MLRLMLRLAVAGVLGLGIIGAVMFDGDPPTSSTGAAALGGKSAEGSCIDCHDSYALNESGSIALLNAPGFYKPGLTYTLTVRLASSQTAGSDLIWGFQLTALNVMTGEGAGTFSNISGQGTSIQSGTGAFATRRYVGVGTGNRAGQSSPVSWQVNWTAPDPGVGAISFYFTGLAANGAQGTNGDWVYQGVQAVQDTTTPTLATTWGELKARYR